MGKEKELEFESYEDAARWFEESDMSDYRKQLVPVELTFDLRKRRDLFELDREIAKSVRILAKRRNVPARDLVNELLRDTIEGLR
ncbi:MAG: CopG family antitoxin [Pseudomonadota bacterium]|jgi:hypothetical protein